jgi:hypothetical protein
MHPSDYLLMDFVAQRKNRNCNEAEFECHGKFRAEIVILVLTLMLEKLDPLFDDDYNITTFKNAGTFDISCGSGGFHGENDEYKGVPYGQSFCCSIFNGGGIFVKGNFTQSLFFFKFLNEF